VSDHVERRCACCGGALGVQGNAIPCPRCGRLAHRRCVRPDHGPDTEHHCSVCGGDPTLAPEGGTAIPPPGSLEAFLERLREAPPPLVSGEQESATVPPEPEELARQRAVAEFRRQLAALTPRPYGTWAVAMTNILMFILMTASGVSAREPDGEALYHWGADVGPKTLGGEWWRLLTCTFVHFGLAHLLLNLAFLLAAGPLVERLLGTGMFLVVYLFAGLAGSLASLFHQPVATAAGASGAVFGVYGALLALLWRHRAVIPAGALAVPLKLAIALIVLDAVVCRVVRSEPPRPRADTPHIVNVAAHLGGFAGGLLAALVLARPLTREARRGQASRSLRAAAAGLMVIAAGAAVLRVWHADVVRAQSACEQTEAAIGKWPDEYNAAFARRERGELSDAAFADFLERQLVPECRAALERLGDPARAPEEYRRPLAALKEYVKLKAEQFELTAQAFRLYAEADRVAANVRRVYEVDKQVIRTFNDAAERARLGTLSDADFADVLERDVLPDWRDMRLRFSSLYQVPDAARPHLAAVLKFLNLRQEAWELLALSLRRSEDERSARAGEVRAQADEANRRAADAWQGLVKALQDAGEKTMREAEAKMNATEEAGKRVRER
jgi:membrane associated rhomboid family serine protease